MFKMIYTTHAICRTFGRNITEESIEATLEYGRNCERNRKAITYRLDRRSIAKAKAKGICLREHEGVHVVVSRKTHVVITVYRSRNFKKVSSKPNSKRRLNSRLKTKK
jgi:hypothetical protein